jgi:hypothetical protein
VGRTTASVVSNYVYDLAILDLSTESEKLDWHWINSRRDKSRSAKQALTAGV